MKEQRQLLARVTTYATADAVNAEGFPAWTPSDETGLEQLAMTGTLGHSFYRDAQAVMTDAVRLLERADAQALAKAIVRGRNEGFMRTFPILGLVYLSKKDAALFQSVFNQVVLTGNDVEDFLGFARAVRGLGRSVKRALGRWIQENTSPFYAQKYRKQLADAIRVSRFKGEDSIYAYVLQAYKGVKGNAKVKVEAAYQRYPVLAAQRDFVAAITAKETALAYQILQENALDVNALTAYYGSFDRTLWRAVAERSPVMRFLKYLAKFVREGVVTQELLDQKLTVTALQKAKVFPFRVYTAYKALQAEANRFRKTPENAETLEMEAVLAHLRKVLNDYAERADWSLFNGAKWVIAPDISGSMTSRIGGSSTLTYAAVSAMFVGFFAKGLEDVTILPWNTKVYEYEVDRERPAVETIETFTRFVGGGTAMEVAVEHLLRRQMETDYVVFLTDTEEYGKGWLTAWKAYHARYPHAVAFVLRGDSYMTSPIPEAEAVALNVYQLFGWNDAVLDYMKFVIATRKMLD